MDIPIQPVTMKPKNKLLLCWAFAAPIFAVGALWAYSSVPITAPWAEFGYYGHFNQVQRIIRSMPDLSIVHQWQHHDVVIEDFTFTVAHRDGTSLEIYFWEGTPQMKLTRDSDIRLHIEGVVADHIRQSNPSRSSPSPATTSHTSPTKPS